MIQEKDWRNTLFDIFNYAFIAVLSFISLAPMLNLLAISLSDNSAVMGGYVTFWPINFTLENYFVIFKSSAIYRAFWISTERTVLGVVISQFLTIITAYPLSKTARQFKGRNFFMWILVFTMLFDGGLIPFFMVIRNLGLINTIWALIVPGVSVWSVILLLNFFKEIPQELEEAALLDGATHWQILWKIYVPLSIPALATLTLFAAVWHWNAWFDGMIFMTDPNNYPLQTYLRTVVVDLNSSNLNMDLTKIDMLSQRSLRGAMIFVTTIPIMVLYPFLQRYFVTGIKLGSVKG
ncbi:MAG: carbohydrate ABC transporter permease [Anaerolineales bacterium]|uniref:carbohydrate ABC transporter permease n=1 Tax=Candidatus Villigracilis proximus TaxID=3140683 RepID=UPI003135122D|nr:carbohydrate ABC transporter permease [Anaerolineales bacterium]